jgi:CBS domain containing-hemolysin-like protein
VAFRPFFVSSAVGSTPAKPTQSIIFSDEYSELHGMDNPDNGIDDEGDLIIKAKRQAIVVTSTLHYPATVSIHTTGGVNISTFDLLPGESVTTPVNNIGVYIVRSADGHHIKKVTVRR